MNHLDSELLCQNSAGFHSALLPSSLVLRLRVLRGTRTISFCQLYSYTHVHDTCRVYRLWHRWQHSCQPFSVASTRPKLMMFNILGHMTHWCITWVLSCPIWCYHYTHLHTSCLTEIKFCALRWGHCPVSASFCASLGKATWSKLAPSSFQLTGQWLPFPYLYVLLFLLLLLLLILCWEHCVEVRAQHSVACSPLLPLDLGLGLSLWFDSQWLLLLNCLSATAIPIHITCFMSQTGSPFPCCSGVSVVSHHCPKRIKIGLEFLFYRKTTTHCRITFICKETLK